LSFKQRIIDQIRENIDLKNKLLQTCIEPIEQCVHRFVESLKNNGKILFCGNGGSAADAQHLAAELVVRLRATFNRSAIPAISLTVNTSILTAAANDFGFENVFARQIEALGRPGDILVAISTSGNSRNVIEAAKTAKQQKIFVIGFLGETGGELTSVVDLPLIIPSNVTPRIQESHILIGHIICELVESELTRNN
jgi:D-sedoheptulose 7-phosphate isomerase